MVELIPAKHFFNSSQKINSSHFWFWKLVNFSPIFFLLKLSPSLFLLASNSPLFFFLKIGQFLASILNFFSQFLAQKIFFFLIKLSPGLFVLARNAFFFLKNFQFFAWKLNFFQLSPSLFFWPEMSLFFFLSWLIFGLKTQFFFHNICPKKSFFSS